MTQAMKGSDLVAAEWLEHKGVRIAPGEAVAKDLPGLKDLRKSGAVVTRKAFLEGQEFRIHRVGDAGKGSA